MKVFAALLSATWRYSVGRRLRLVLYVTMFVLANVTYLFEPYAIGLALNAVQESAGSAAGLSRVLLYLFIVLCLSAGFWVFHGPARVIERVNAFHLRNDFKDHLFRIVTSLPMQWHKQHHSGKTINRIGKATRALGDFAEHSYLLIEMLMRPLAALVALVFLMPQAALIAVSVGIFALAIVFVFDRVLLPLYSKINDKEHFVALALHDYITNIMTVITLRLEQLARNEVWLRMTHYFPMYRREVVLNEVKWFVASMVVASMTFCVLGWYAYSTIGAGAIPLAGTFFMLYEYMQKIGGAFFTFAWKYSETVQQYADLKSVDMILAAEQAQYGDDCRLPTDWKSLEIRHLQFTYKDEEQREHHLRDVHITLGRTSKIALVGESGSGKSTLMAVIRGLQIPDSVSVTCDGTVLAHGLRDIASTVTLIPQEPEIFENTIEYNITLDTDQSSEEVMNDVRLAEFDSVLTKLPHGLQTNTAEKGVNLSGGEKQRLALARGFFAAKHGSTRLTTGSDIILLDEPTSSVDSQNERKIYRNLMETFANRCVVSSIHKLHLLEFFDTVYVLENGRVIEHGSPAELKKGNGKLAELWRGYSQAGEIEG